MAAVKKAQAEDKGPIPKATVKVAASSRARVVGTAVTVTVGAGPIHHAGRRYAPGESLDVSVEVAAALVAAKLVTKG